jgi:hypothetical protein
LLAFDVSRTWIHCSRSRGREFHRRDRFDKAGKKTSNKASNVSSNMDHCQTCKSFDSFAKFTGETRSGRANDALRARQRRSSGAFSHCSPASRPLRCVREGVTGTFPSSKTYSRHTSDLAFQSDERVHSSWKKLDGRPGRLSSASNRPRAVSRALGMTSSTPRKSSIST